MHKSSLAVIQAMAILVAQLDVCWRSLAVI